MTVRFFRRKSKRQSGESASAAHVSHQRALTRGAIGIFDNTRSPSAEIDGQLVIDLRDGGKTGQKGRKLFSRSKRNLPA